jgi:hypothetical protein
MKKTNFKKISKKILCFALCAVLVSIMMCGCSSEDTDGVEAPDGTVGVTNDAVHFSFCYPQNWQCDRNDGMISVSPLGTGSKASISVHEGSAMSEAVNPVDYWSKSKAELESSGNECTFIEKKEMTLDGVTACQAVYDMKINGKVYKVSQIFAYNYVDSSHRMFTITFTGTSEDYSNNDIVSAYKTVVDNFKFKD